MSTKTFNHWLYEDGRNEALKDVYFEDQIGPGSEYHEWAESVYKAMLLPPSVNEPRDRIWPFTK